MAVRRLDGHVGKIAIMVADSNQDNWHGCDFDLYAPTEIPALSEEFPRLTDREKLPLLLAGLDPQFYNHLAPRVREGEINTCKEFIDAGNKLKRERIVVMTAMSLLLKIIIFKSRLIVVEV